MIQVKYIANTGGSIVGESTQYVNAGYPTTEVTAVPDDGYNFVRWIDGDVTAERTDSFSDDMIIIAFFARDTELDDLEYLLNQYKE